MTGGGVALAVVVAIMVAVSVTLLPSFLGLSGHAINRFGLRRNASAGAGWSRVGHVTHHAWAYAVGVTALLLALAVPVTALRVGMPDGRGTGDQPHRAPGPRPRGAGIRARS
jgi:RND superfamily putative drug exporter